jgi:hypothetical protein
MHASRVALIAAVLAIPSAAHSQDSGLVDGKVGSDLSTSSTQSGSPLGLTRAYQRPPETGPRAGSSGMVMPGQVVPEEVPVFIRPDGSGAAFVAGQRVIVSPNSIALCGLSSNWRNNPAYAVSTLEARLIFAQP